MAEMTEAQGEIIGYLARQVVGPAGGPDEILDDVPHRRYLMGTLYPRNSSTDDDLGDEEADGRGGSLRDELADDPVQRANEWLPGSIGLSFCCSGIEELQCAVDGARYEEQTEGRRRRWARTSLTASSPEILRFTPPGDGTRTTRGERCLKGRAEVQVTWRPLGGGFLVTVTLINAQSQTDPAPVDNDLTLHQVSMSCEVAGGEIVSYPDAKVLSNDEEEEELRLLHRHVQTYAVGHGCAAAWGGVPAAEPVTRVWTELIPAYTIAPVVHGGGSGDDVLLLSRLMDEDFDASQLRSDLDAFVDGYARWADGLAAGSTANTQAASRRVLGRLTEAVARLRRGVEVLTAEPDGHLLRAFRLANRAMLMQMRHSQDDLGGARRPANSAARGEVGYDGLDNRWRPFQLAYLLIVLPGLVEPEDKDRDLVDLIWFPTGGGKTEAYLAVAAVEILLRRLRDPLRGAGTAVITRYTLRLLTAQQFQRTAALVCALELIRRDDPEHLGPSEISIGLWVGGGLTPNSFAEANETLDDLLEDPEPKNPFQLESCPWCGTEIIPSRKTRRELYGVRSGNAAFSFFCPGAGCAFHERLPVGVVDEELYSRPPTILIATVDKFARLAWVQGGGSFFGSADVDPPSLIIQDELHLLSGPLGTAVGIYEAAVDGAIRARGGRPKILASTATIRRAGEQVDGLFGREVRLFPPSGLDARDSYFARTDPDAPGRTYIGVMSQSHTAATSMINVASALLQAPVEIGLTGAELDAYWTLIAYHNSLRELGRTVTQARDDIPKRLEAMTGPALVARSLGDDTVVELTGNVDGAALTSLLERLKLTEDDPGAASFVATTNMLSVGVDVPRLGLMLVNGQPKTTSEYIQATSRVGRGKVPGLVISLYSSTRPRDRSHYESYIPFHASLYRRVEPTSVTPFSLPSRERALHAALVILVRHGAGLGANDLAGSFDPADPATAALIDGLRRRCAEIDPREANETGRHLDRLIEEWRSMADEAAGSGRALYYVERSKQHSSLLKDFGAEGAGWDTMSSLRSVDRQSPIWVLGEESG